MYKGGLFSPPVIACVGDPYIDQAKLGNHAHGMSKGLRQFGIGKGLPGKFNRLFEGEEYKNVSKLSANDRMKDRQGFLTPNGFAHTSPIKKSVSPGDFYGTFTPKGIPHMTDGVHGDRTKKEAFKKFENRNIYTAPPKKSSIYGAQGTTPNILFMEFEYIESPYDAYHQTEKV